MAEKKYTFDKTKRQWKSPAKRSKQFAEEVKTGVHVNGDKEGKELTEKERSYRAGYFQCQTDHAGMYRFKQATDAGYSYNVAKIYSRQKGTKLNDLKPKYKTKAEVAASYQSKGKKKK